MSTPMIKHLYQIEGRTKRGDSFCAGFESRAGSVVRAAPIIKFMIGWDKARVLRHCDNLRWKIFYIDPNGSARKIWTTT